MQILKLSTKSQKQQYLERIRHNCVRVCTDDQLAVSKNQRQSSRQWYEHRGFVLKFDGGESASRLPKDADARSVNERLHGIHQKRSPVEGVCMCKK